MKLYLKLQEDLLQACKNRYLYICMYVQAVSQYSTTQLLEQYSWLAGNPRHIAGAARALLRRMAAKAVWLPARSPSRLRCSVVSIEFAIEVLYDTLRIQ